MKLSTLGQLLLLELVTICTSTYSNSKSTQPGHPSMGKCNEY